MIAKTISDDHEDFTKFKVRIKELIEMISVDDPLFPAAEGRWWICSPSEPTWPGDLHGTGAVSIFTPIALREIVKIVARRYNIKVPADLQVGYEQKK